MVPAKQKAAEHMAITHMFHHVWSHMEYSIGTFNILNKKLLAFQVHCYTSPHYLGTRESGDARVD